MNKTTISLLALACMAAVAAFAAPAGAQTGYTLEWHTVDGGGEMSSTGGSYTLSGTIGQHDAGVLVGDGYQLTGGFWFGTPPGDCNADSLVNLLDHADFVPCLDGPGISLSDPACRCFDYDADDDIDLLDFAAFQERFAG